MARQGWLALGSQAGDQGMGMVSILLQELGRAACPAPLLDAFMANVVLCRLAPPQDSVRELTGQIHEGKAAVSCALGPLDGDANAGALELSGQRLGGRASFVEGTSVATHLLAVTRADEVAIVSARDPSVSIAATPGFSVPPLAEIDVNGANAMTTLRVGKDLRTLQAIARLGLVSRALGAATRGFEMVTEYAKVRVQFGKKIGQYQAIQHKLANCLIGLETSRLALARAAASFDSDSADWRYAAGAAFAIAGPALRQVCLETHHAFGGVSFWEEHEMPRHFRRIHADLVRCGGVHAAREDVAAHLLGEIA
jgi:acyl-CoA dehydrogenase